MSTGFRLKEALCLEDAAGKHHPILPAGRAIPATWQQAFTTGSENQRSFDLQLVRGEQNPVALGKWRVGGLPAAPAGAVRPRVEIRVGGDGSIGVRAALENSPLPVTLLTEAYPKVPLTFRSPVIPPEKTIPQPCPQCSSRLVLRHTNWKNETFGLCLDCGHEFALPEPAAQPDPAPEGELPPELLQTLGITPPRLPGGLDPESLRELEEKGFPLDDLIPLGPRAAPKDSELSVEEILRLAGEPLPEDQRQNCPKCNAVIVRDAHRCEWCGQKL